MQWSDERNQHLKHLPFPCVANSQSPLCWLFWNTAVASDSYSIVLENIRHYSYPTTPPVFINYPFSITPPLMWFIYFFTKWVRGQYHRSYDYISQGSGLYYKSTGETLCTNTTREGKKIKNIRPSIKGAYNYYYFIYKHSTVSNEVQVLQDMLTYL